MTRLLILLGLIMFLLWSNYQSSQHPQLKFNALSDRILHPLDTRLRYRIAEVDPRFGLTITELKLITQQATDIWTQGTGKEAFVYDPKAKLTIHLIYDERQDNSNQRRQQLGHIENNQKVWADKNQNLQQFKQEIDWANIQLDNNKNQLAAQLQQYNQHITEINKNGGIPSSQRDLLIQQRHQLQQDIFLLEQNVNRYNQKIQQLNQQVNELNQMNDQLNHAVDQFNQRFQPRLFDKGAFDGSKIMIYEFSSTADLRLTLAHEFGHALGLQHNHDPQALMFPMMQKQDLQNFKLTSADLALLNAR